MPETFGDWYGKNRDDFNAKRRARYKKDVDYKKRVQGYTRRYRKEHPRRLRQDDGSVKTVINGKKTLGFRTGKVAEILGVSAEAIRYLEKQAWIPNTKQGDGLKRIYTKRQIALIQKAFDTRAAINAGAVPKDHMGAKKKEIWKEWNEDDGDS